MKLEFINSHLDKCTGDHTKIPIGRTAFASKVPLKPTKSPERLPQLSYSLFKEVALRKKLVELGISAAGNRPVLERRHTEWVTLWNANCDSSKPRKKADLLHDLEIWERTQGSRAPTQGSLSMGSEIRNKDFDGAGWSAKYEDSFQSLIESARRKIVTNKSNQSSELEPDVTGGNNRSRDAATLSENRPGMDTMPVEPSKEFPPAVEKSAVDSLMSDTQMSQQNVEWGVIEAGGDILSPLPQPSPQESVYRNGNGTSLGSDTTMIDHA